MPQTKGKLVPSQYNITYEIMVNDNRLLYKSYPRIIIFREHYNRVPFLIDQFESPNYNGSND